LPGPPSAGLPFAARLSHPTAWTPSEVAAAQQLPLPKVREGRLGSMCSALKVQNNAVHRKTLPSPEVSLHASPFS
jgi:hypothetical protein